MPALLQISDPHLMSSVTGTLKGVPTAESLQSVLVRARAEVAHPDRVILSGDLSHEETLAGYELLQNLLGDWCDRCLLIPGNHDDRRALREVFDQVPGTGSDEVWFRESVGDWQLIGLDSQVHGEGYGELSEKMLSRLESWLSSRFDQPTLIFLHHHPVPVNSRWIDRIGLHNASQLERLLRANQAVKGVFCGHIHQEFEGRIAGVPVYSVPSASHQFVPKDDKMRFDLRPPGFRVIDLQAASVATRIVRLEDMVFRPRDE